MIEYTQYQKILSVMASRRGQQKWFLPQDFMKQSLGTWFVGYEASARLSELAKKYPELLASERQGKYMARRIIYENLSIVMETLPSDLKVAINRALPEEGQTSIWP